MNLEPARVVADGNVKLDSRPATGEVEHLEIDIESAAPQLAADGQPRGGNGNPAAGDPRGPGPAGNVGRPGDRAANQDSPLGKITRRFDIRGRVLRARLGRRDGELDLLEAWGEDDVQIVETHNVDPAASPVRLFGDRLHMVNHDPSNSWAELLGEPAHAEAGGMTLKGGRIHLDRSGNRLSIPGPGQLATMISPQMTGAMAAPGNRAARPLPPAAAPEKVPLVIGWKGGMEFDGQLATFDTEVVAQVDQRRFESNRMEATLTEPIRFGERGGSGPEDRSAQIDRIICRGSCFMESRTLVADEVQSIERMQARDLVVENQSGSVNAAGPGWVVQVRRGGIDALRPPELNPTGRVTQPTTNIRTNTRLSFLRVQFQGPLTGNFHNRQMSFTEGVETVYGPVDKWDETLDVDRLGERGVWMKCRTMTVRQVTTLEEQATELNASGDVRIRGSDFRAWGEQLTYTDAKDLLILQGDGRSDAQLWRQEKVGGRVAHIPARKIFFWRSLNRVKLEDVSGGEFGDFGNGNGSSARRLGPGQ